MDSVENTWGYFYVLYVCTSYGAGGTVLREACCVKCYMVLWRVYLFEAAGPLKTLHASRLTLHVFSLSKAARPIA